MSRFRSRIKRLEGNMPRAHQPAHPRDPHLLDRLSLDVKKAVVHAWRTWRERTGNYGPEARPRFDELQLAPEHHEELRRALAHKE